MDLREQLSRRPYLILEGSGPAETAGRRRRLPAFVIPAILFALTAVTTQLANGPAYAASLMAILLVHEMGHYLMCRRYSVPSTLPYFIPLPPQISFLGTLGAVIRMRLHTGERRVLYDIGIAGPLAGLVIAIPVAAWGLAHSQVVEGTLPGPGLILGDSLIFRALQWLVLGSIDPDRTVVLHPVALAGWTGLFVTGLNLIPVGMLDGGHVVYGLFGKRSVLVAAGSMVVLAILGLTVFRGWWFWFGLLLLLGVRHPASRLPSRRLDRRRIALGILALIIFILCFVPRPFEIQ